MRGVVQGVGFRPFVYRLARELGLTGTVLNDSRGVTIEVEGVVEAVEAFVRRLAADAPPRADVQGADAVGVLPRLDREFVILSSVAGARGRASVPPDVAVCESCLAELFDPGDRRYRYPFINCTDCGPRYTILEGIPYDRAQTSMGRFRMCPTCRAEYEDPTTRRFHAQPNACPECGPRVCLLDRDGSVCTVADPVAEAATRLVEGEIVALRSPGGFHLACDAANGGAIAKLRRRKGRPHKPLAVMVRDLDGARGLARTTTAEQEELSSWRRPIVLLRPESGSPLAPQVCEGSPYVGVMLPYTPLQHLLLAGPLSALVMTSGNRDGEPIVCDHEDALLRLARLADAFLSHDLETRQRADDSVVSFVAGAPVPLRRSRGYVPRPVRLPRSTPPLAAVGGDLKCVPCVAQGRDAVLGQHVGDLEHPRSIDLADRTLSHLRRLCHNRPHLFVHDLHPDYHSTRLAQRLADDLGVDTLAVQHHHAHALACLADNGWADPALAITLDGTGFGSDGGAWGGEILAVDGLHFERLAHLRSLPLPGGDRAAREPWRMAVAVLHRALDGAIPRELAALPPFLQDDPGRRDGVLRLLDRPGLCGETTSAGRLFDAVSSLLGVRQVVTYEGQAAIELEALASSGRIRPPLPYRVEGRGRGRWQVDLLPAVTEIAAQRAAGEDAAALARGFHVALAAALTDATGLASETSGLATVALGGGVLCNRLLTRELARRLRQAGFDVLMHRQVPPNDGGLALGQAWAGALHLSGAAGPSI